MTIILNSEDLTEKRTLHQVHKRLTELAMYSCSRQILALLQVQNGKMLCKEYPWQGLKKREKLLVSLSTGRKGRGRGSGGGWWRAQTQCLEVIPLQIPAFVLREMAATDGQSRGAGMMWSG